MKLLVLANLDDDGAIGLAADMLPAAVEGYGVDLVVTLGLPADRAADDETRRRLAEAGVAAHVLLAPGPTDCPACTDQPSMTTVGDGGGPRLALVAVAPPGDALDAPALADAIRALVTTSEGPALLVVRHPSTTGKLQLLERCQDSLAAFVGCGSGLATAEPLVTAAGCAFVADMGLHVEVPALLAPTVDDWDEPEPAVDALLVDVDDETNRAFQAFGLHWTSADRPGAAEVEGFSHELFYTALKRAQQAQDVAVLFDEVTAVARRVFGHERVAAGYRFADDDSAQFLFSRQLFPDDQPAFAAAVEKILSRDEVVLSPTTPVATTAGRYLAAADWKAQTSTPDVRCVLGIAWNGDDDVPAATAELVTELHGVLRSSLLRLQFVQSLRDQIERTTTLLQISNALGATIELDDLLVKVVELASRVIGAEYCSVLLYDERTNMLVSRVATDQGRAGQRHERFPADVGVAGWVHQHGQSQLINDPASDPRHESHLDRQRAIETRNLLCVPLKVQDRAVGVVEVRNKGEGKVFTQADQDLLEAVANQAVNPIENARLHQNVRDMYRSTVDALASAIDAKDPYTHGHSRRVTLYAQAMAEELGWTEDKLEEIVFVGLLHDIGKIGVEDAVLGKRGPLTDEERAHINLHPARGAQMLEHVSFLVSKIPGVRHHHERFDGKGYPDGLKGAEIPIEAQIICIVDAFDAMTSDRPYRSGMEPAVALERILQCSGTQFAPDYVQLFQRIFDEKIMPIYRRYKDQSKAEARQEGTPS